MLHSGVCAFLISCLVLSVSGGQHNGQIGYGFYLPKLDITNPADFYGGTNLLEEVPANCLITSDNKLSSRTFKFFKDTSSAMHSIATDSSVSASLQNSYTFKASLSAKTSYAYSKSMQLTGSALIMSSTVMEKTLDRNCLQLKLDSSFKKSFENLPAEVPKEMYISSWNEYVQFLHTYGSHMVIDTSYGAKIQQWTFAKSSSQYTQRDFKLKACASMAGPTSAGKLGVSACVGVSTSGMSASSAYDMTNKIIISGGNGQQNLINPGQRTPANIESFLKTASKTQAIAFKFQGVWELLKMHYVGTDHYGKALNLQWLFTGLLGHECTRKKTGDFVLQEFVRSSRYTKLNPQYVCRVGAVGCNTNDDCHLGAWSSHCYCYGDSCVDQHPKKVGNLKFPNPVIRTRNIGGTWQGPNASCYMHSGVWCYCNKSAKPNRWENFWSSENI